MAYILRRRGQTGGSYQFAYLNQVAYALLRHERIDLGSTNIGMSPHQLRFLSETGPLTDWEILSTWPGRPDKIIQAWNVVHAGEGSHGDPEVLLGRAMRRFTQLLEEAVPVRR